MKNNMSYLEKLRAEKEILKRECAESELRLADHWSYMTKHTGSLLFHSVAGSVAQKLGFGLNAQPGKEVEPVGSMGVMKGLFNTVSPYYPLLWEFAQPLLLRFAIKKMKSIFSWKKKKKQKKD